MELTDQPLMDDHEIEALHNLLAERQPRRLLEWGSGGSTLYWPQRFPDIQWISVEHNGQYYGKVRKACAPWVVLLHLSLPEYIELKRHHLGQFEFIIVDGYPKSRVRCLERAQSLLAEGGATLLHDSHHPPYLVGRDQWKRVTEICPPNKDGKRGLMLFEQPKGSK